MADDLLVTDAVLEDKLVLRRLLSDMIERLPNDVAPVAEQKILQKAQTLVGGGAAAGTITLAGDVIGNGAFNSNGDAIVTTSIAVAGGLERDVICPGYLPTYVAANTITVPGDSRVFFSPAKRVRVIDSDKVMYGIVNTVTYDSATQKTTIVLTLDNSGDVLTTGITSICALAGGANQSWARIYFDSVGTNFNGIATHTIGTTPTWVIGTGRYGYDASGNPLGPTVGGVTVSQDLGATFKYIDLNAVINNVHYDVTLNLFWACGYYTVGAGTTLQSRRPAIFKSLDGVTWTELSPSNATKYYTVAGGEHYLMEGQCNSIVRSPYTSSIFASIGVNKYDNITLVQTGSATLLFKSTDGGATWAYYDETSRGDTSIPGGTAQTPLVTLMKCGSYLLELRPLDALMGIGGNVKEFTMTGDESLIYVRSDTNGAAGYYHYINNIGNLIWSGAYSTIRSADNLVSPNILQCVLDSKNITPAKIYGASGGIVELNPTGKDQQYTTSDYRLVTNGFAPTETVNSIAEDTDNMVLIAVGNAGSICTSISGFN